jgi:hypothetical protein
MENKYYTPTIEEFHVGFEYEYRNTVRDSSGNQIKSMWKKETFGLDMPGWNLETVFIMIQNDNIRVKYLDKEDIESLGFEKSKKNQWVGYEDYFSGNVSGEYGYFLYVTIHYPRLYTKSKRVEDNLFKIIVHRHYTSNEYETSNIDYSLNTNESEVVFKGTIKNKHELERVLTMLNIL